MAKPVFSKWVHWDQRRCLRQCSGPGLYVLAQFEGAPPRETDPVDERVLLIAETHAQTLAERWMQFDAAATRGKNGHSGGRQFWDLYGDGVDSVIPGWLYVAAASVPAKTDNVQFYLRNEKDALLDQYQERHGRLPACNARGPQGMSSPAPPAQGTSVNISRWSITDPLKNFSGWIRWAERSTAERVRFPGIYALAKFEPTAPDHVDVLNEHVIYLGETCDNSLRGRLNQFNRSAFQQKDGHSGGLTYRNRCADEGDDLFLAIYPVDELTEPHRSAFIRHVERSLLWRYVCRWGRRPSCNSK